MLILKTALQTVTNCVSTLPNIGRLDDSDGCIGSALATGPDQLILSISSLIGSCKTKERIVKSLVLMWITPFSNHANVSLSFSNDEPAVNSNIKHKLTKTPENR